MGSPSFLFSGDIMLITVLKSKIHRATVTDANLGYVGSCAIDEDLMIAANIRTHEQIHIYNINNGERFTTYAIPSDIPGTISLNGSAARKGVIGDILIIATYGMISDTDFHEPTVIFVNENNKLTMVPK
jgi:aspartate 1-decarboxylase